MKKVTEDVQSILSIREKENILKEIQQDDLLALFKKGYTPQYRKIEAKKTTLDQQISIAIDESEKNMLKQELTAIKNLGDKISLSSFIRNRSTSTIDIEEWHEEALKALKELKTDAWNPKKIKAKKGRYLKLMEDIDEKDSFEFIRCQEVINECNDKLASFKRVAPQRRYRTSARVTYTEANQIRWRAARLSLTVADYMRFSIFGYLPFSDADKHLSMEARKRFYVSVLDVARNGWGEPPEVEDCQNCSRLKHENEILRERLKRYEMLLKTKE